MLVQEEKIVYVNDTEMESVIVDLESQVPVPFVGVTIRSENPSEFVLKSKVDGSKNPYWKQITKVSTKTYLLVTNYRKRVENNLKKEGKDIEEYIQGQLKGKEHITKSVLTDKETKTKRYVMLEWFPETKGTTTYFNEGNELDKTFLKTWMNFTEKTYDNQGTDRHVTPITPLFSSIVELNVNGTKYIRRVN